MEATVKSLNKLVNIKSGRLKRIVYYGIKGIIRDLVENR